MSEGKRLQIIQNVIEQIKEDEERKKEDARRAKSSILNTNQPILNILLFFSKLQADY